MDSVLPPRLFLLPRFSYSSPLDQPSVLWYNNYFHLVSIYYASDTGERCLTCLISYFFHQPFKVEETGSEKLMELLKAG